MKKYDERNTLFSRVDLIKNTDDYKTYYKEHPKARRQDDLQRNIKFRDRLRKSDEFKRLFFPLIKNNKKIIKNVHTQAFNHKVSKNRVDVPSGFHVNIKEIAKYYGATDVGIVKLNDTHYYSHQGGESTHLGLNTYGKEVKKSYHTAIVYTIEMKKEYINRAPMYEELLATEEAYVRVAEVGSKLTMYLKDLGYKAMFNHSEYYIAPMVPLAYDAGLGDIGMCNHIVTKEYGNRVRLGAVFTTLKLKEDHPVDYGLHEFCKKCALCLINCPSHAITHKERIVHNRPFYKFDDNKCYDMWLKSGTDCGTCLNACPLSQGIDLEKIEKMKDNPDLMDEIMKDYLDKFGRRVFIKKDLPIVRMDNDDE